MKPESKARTDWDAVVAKKLIPDRDADVSLIA